MRLYTSTADPIDLCRRCAAGLTDAEAFDRWGHDGDGPDDRGNCFAFDVEHPPYDDGEMHYTCDDCGRPLTLRD
jgi:hypothetical protein